MSSCNLTIGIVGLPNVGKSTLFNALLRREQALAANYPFATIEPNTGIVEVPDTRLGELANVVERTEGGRPPLKPAVIEFVDIAGLVKGASEGEGLGNQFLANIRETDLICHVLRAFKDEDVIVTGSLDPKEDLDVVRMELILKDMETLEKQEKRLKKEKNKIWDSAWERARVQLEKGEMLSRTEWNEEEMEFLGELHLLSMKPEIFVVNMSEGQLTSGVERDFHEKIGVSTEDVVYVSARIESELASLDGEEQAMYMEELGLKESGILRMARVGYHKLGLISFLTAGIKEVRAWTCRAGSTAPEAAGVIHTDFTKKFIKAKVCGFEDFVSLVGWKAAAEKGKVRMEGKEYVMKDGDVVEFMIGS